MQFESFRSILSLTTAILIATLFSPSSYGQQQLAFPTAEGYGKYTVGGRGGKVYEVTNLNPSGEGSFRAAIEAKGPRTVVFRVSGTIDADLSIKNDFITIAGQTAPGDGICLKGTLGINASNVIVRFLRVRAEGRGDAVTSRYKKNIILDHVSASWSGDEVMTLYHGENVTIQWCMITEACSDSHKFGGIWGNRLGSYHHNLLAHNASRNPRFASGSGANDFRNNVIYNWQYESVYGGESQQPTKATSAHELNKTLSDFSVNVVANYFKPGPGTNVDHKTKICAPWSRNGTDDYGDWYVANNVVNGSPVVTEDNWKGVFPKSDAESSDRDAIPGLKLEKPWDSMPIRQESAEDAYKSVLTGAGCCLPNRDSVDTRIVAEVRNGTADRGGNGFVSDPKVAGGWPPLESTPAPEDTDHDGTPDEWEVKNDLDPKDGDDGNHVASDGYTRLEKYLNSIK